MRLYFFFDLNIFFIQTLLSTRWVTATMKKTTAKTKNVRRIRDNVFMPIPSFFNKMQFL